MSHHSRRAISSRRAVVAPLLLALLLLGGWQLLVTLTDWPDYVLPAPAGVAQRLVQDLAGTTLWRHLGVTLLEALGGCLLGILVGLPLAVAIHESRWFSAAANPFLGATQAIPAIALAPLLVLWVGYGLFPVMVLCHQTIRSASARKPATSYQPRMTRPLPSVAFSMAARASAAALAETALVRAKTEYIV